MKKILYLLILFPAILFSQGTTTQNITINRAAAQFWGNGTGAGLKLYNTRIYESSGSLVSTGNFNLLTNSLLGSGSIGSLATPFAKVWTIDLNAVGVVEFPTSIKLGTTTLTSTQAGYLNDVTSPIGQSLGLKANSDNTTLTGITTMESFTVGGGVQIDSILSPSGWEYIVKRGNDTLNSYIPDNLRGDASDYVPFLSDSTFMYVTPTQLSASKENPLITAITVFGGTCKALPVGTALDNVVDSHTLLDAQAWYVAFNLLKPTVLTGVKWMQGVAGNYTGDAWNGIALYSVTGTTYTKVDSTANDANIWKATASTVATKAFATPYTAAAGAYMLAFVYNSSAETAAPVIYNFNKVNPIFHIMFATNKLSGYVDAQATLPHTETAGDVTSGDIIPGIWLY